MRRSLLVAVIVALLAGACGGSDRAETVPDTAPVTAAPDPQPSRAAGKTPQRAPDTKDAQEALLALEDLPVGWTSSPPEPDDDDDTFFCKGLDPLEDLEAAGKADAKYQVGPTGPFVFHEVSLFKYEDEAERVMGLTQDGLTQCREFTGMDDGVSYKGTFTAISFPRLGEETVAAKMSMTGTGVVVTGDMVIVRTGRAVSTVFHFAIEASFFGGGSKLDSRLTEELARKAEAKQRALS